MVTFRIRFELRAHGKSRPRHRNRWSVSDGLRTLNGKLLDNARQATLAAGSREPIVVSLSAEPDGALSLEVIDRGVGIPAADLAHVGEPFFSTREPGQGMGLGVYLAQGAAALHGAAISHRSDGVGTTATLTFPPPPIA